MSGEKVESKEEHEMQEPKDDNTVLRKENESLKERLQLYQTNWLYAHHNLSSITLGIIFGIVISTITYLLAYCVRLLVSYAASEFQYMLLFVIFGFPSIVFLLLVAVVKAPELAFKSFIVYSITFISFQALVVWINPLAVYKSADISGFIFSLSVLDGIVAFLVAVILPGIAWRCGYRLILNPSALAFRVTSEKDIVSKQLEKLGEDFTFSLDRSQSSQERLYFVRSSNIAEKLVVQALLSQEPNGTLVILTIHSIKNDVPMSADPAEAKKISRTLMKWLEVTTGSNVTLSKDEALITESIEGSKRSFHRRPIRMPSKQAVRNFGHKHWKDILIIISTIAAVVALLR